MHEMPALPAFLDALDEVTIWLPEPQPLAALSGKVRVFQGEKPLTIAKLAGRERVAPGRDPNKIVVAGSFQGWNPASEETRMTRESEGVWSLTLALPAGDSAYKIARGGTWDENWGVGFAPGGGNIALSLKKPALVTFLVDFNARTVCDSVNQPEKVAPPTALPPRPKPASEETGATKFYSVSVQLARPLPPDAVAEPLFVQVGDGPKRVVFARGALDSPVFFHQPDDLGARWTKAETTFHVWSPPSRKVDLLLFESENSERFRRISMARGSNGVWSATVHGNLHGVFYQWELSSYGQVRRAADVYGTAARADSTRSMVADLRATNPPGWGAPRPFQGKSQADAVLYEAHIRDLTIDPASGVKPEWRGKYLGASEKAGYLKALGVTHVHLLPFQDYNFGNSKGYNWGYETTLFNVPEEQYSTNAADPLARTREVKRMVLAFQRAGIGVVLDVVYNHSVPSEGPGSAFWECVPYYYFRTNDRGDVLNESGVGNALHDERPMVRKFIRESLVFWSREYRLDGFRFDLLGMFSKESVRDWARAIRADNPRAAIYGEPWTGGGPLRFGKGDQRGSGVAVFNDHFRNLVRGDLDDGAPGFAAGGKFDRAALEKAVSGSIHDFADAPTESVNYVSAHDNRTFWDRIARNLPDPRQQAAAVKLAHAMALLSQGVPFLEGGVEIGRTKGGRDNSYNAGDAVNRFDWNRAGEFADVEAYFRGLIALRRAHPAFRCATRAEVERTLTFVPASQTPPNAFAFLLDGRARNDSWREILVVFHNGPRPTELPLPPGTWHVVADDKTAGVRPLRPAKDRLTLAPLSANVLYRD